MFCEMMPIVKFTKIFASSLKKYSSVTTLKEEIEIYNQPY